MCGSMCSSLLTGIFFFYILFSVTVKSRQTIYKCHPPQISRIFRTENSQTA